MKKFIFSTFFFLSVVFLGLNITTVSSIAAGECHTDANGKVIIKNTTNSATLPANATPISSDGGANFNKDNCLVSPLFYRMEGYTILLCNSDPYISAATPDLTKCPTTIVDRADNNPKIIEIPLGEEVDLLGDEGLTIPLGIYSHAVFIGSTHLAVKHNVEFVRNDNGAAFTMDGYNAAGDGPETGSKCWTVKDLATTYNNLSASSHTNAAGTARSYTLPNPGDEHTITLTCGASIVTTAGDTQEYGYSFEIIDSLGDDFLPHSDYRRDVSTDDDTLRAFVLLQSSGVIADTYANAKKIAYIAQLPTALNISENTIAFKINIATSSTVSLDVHRSGANPQTLEAKKMGVEPFGIKFQTKTRQASDTFR